MLKVFEREGHPLSNRILVNADNKPFVYLADTAWELIHRATFEEIEFYIRNRAEKGFTVVTSVILAEFNGLTEPNAYGELPLINGNPNEPNEAYFKVVDFFVETAEKHGMYAALLPTWGDKVNKKWGQGPEIFTPENAYEYGSFLGERYKNKPVVWVLGGDRPIETEKHLEVWRALAKGLKEKSRGELLITYHPMGGHSSSEWLHDEGWLDFNMVQSGHSEKHLPNYLMIQRDYSLRPVKPVVEGEARYENHPVNWDPSKGRFDAHDVREAAYWAIFSGACGFTYGCNEVWMMYEPENRPLTSTWTRHFHPRLRWIDALDVPGASQMKYLRELLEGRLGLLQPDQTLLLDAGSGSDYTVACRAIDESFAMVYVPTGKPFKLNLKTIEGVFDAWWYDPSSGARYHAGRCRGKQIIELSPPTSGPLEDWVFILEHVF
ncbi:MAG: glycoside hydrolase family 140 protein [Thermofilaceae archaeon]|nr:glycoside hydrolase family 140 protein [Thermofilaceae archaeon]MCX8180038.1 glycoside hydrolase family 140 protein [Thermofilaceae archaeon]MDW8003219.1 glycoside hydrolase family 140 protein [Thermofilaceae archaeon]